MQSSDLTIRTALKRSISVNFLIVYPFEDAVYVQHVCIMFTFFKANFVDDDLIQIFVKLFQWM